MFERMPLFEPKRVVESQTAINIALLLSEEKLKKQKL